MKEIALARQHNDANISIPAVYFYSTGGRDVETFINTAFEGGRHQNRKSPVRQFYLY
jgi:ribose 5-phosphate isomerase B